MPETVKPCSDCKYVTEDYRCRRPQENSYPWFPDVQDERLNNGPCGHEGVFFEVKPEFETGIQWKTIYNLPIRLWSLANERVHWSIRHKRSQAHRHAALIIQRQALPCIVTITRRGRRKMDTDNLAISAKALRDSIAARLGVDDGSDLIEWRYKQELAGSYSAVVEIESRC